MPPLIIKQVIVAIIKCHFSLIDINLGLSTITPFDVIFSVIKSNHVSRNPWNSFIEISSAKSSWVYSHFRSITSVKWKSRKTSTFFRSYSMPTQQGGFLHANISFTFFHKTNSYNGLIIFIPPNIALIGLSTLYMFPHPVTRNADCPCSLRNRRVCCYFYAIKNLANFTVAEILPSIKFI